MDNKNGHGFRAPPPQPSIKIYPLDMVNAFEKLFNDDQAELHHGRPDPFDSQSKYQVPAERVVGQEEAGCSNCQVNSVAQPMINPPLYAMQSNTKEVRQVWRQNLEEEFTYIRRLLPRYSTVSVDTEFQGPVLIPSETNYEMLSANVNLLSPLQLGLSLMDDMGNRPTFCVTWQFNFEFDIEKNLPRDLIRRQWEKAGIDFRRHKEEGVNLFDFMLLFLTPGYLFNDYIKWIGFNCGYDFGFLIKMINGPKLPDKKEDFLSLLNMFFPHLRDIQFIMGLVPTLTGGLENVANQLELMRLTGPHQAGGSALLIGKIYIKMVEKYKPIVRSCNYFISAERPLQDQYMLSQRTKNWDEPVEFMECDLDESDKEN